MERGPKVTLEPKVEAVVAKANGGEIFLRTGGETFVESRVLGTPLLA